MVEKLTFNYLATSLVDIPSGSMPIACSLNLRHLWHCVVTTAHLSGLLLPHAQGVMILLFNQLLDMPYLSDGWIIFAKEKCSLTGMLRFVYNI